MDRVYLENELNSTLGCSNLNQEHFDHICLGLRQDSNRIWKNLVGFLILKGSMLSSNRIFLVPLDVDSLAFQGVHADQAVHIFLGSCFEDVQVDHVYLGSYSEDVLVDHVFLLVRIFLDFHSFPGVLDHVADHIYLDSFLVAGSFQVSFLVVDSFQVSSFLDDSYL